MAIAFKVFVAVILVAILFQAAYSGYFVWRGRRLAKTTYTGYFELGNATQLPFRFFVSGDSIAAGVGATSRETSVGGHIAEYLTKSWHVLYTNTGKSGAKMADLLTLSLPQEKQDLTFLLIGSNNVIKFTSYRAFATATEQVLARYAPTTQRLIIAGPGKVSAATLFPLPLRWIYAAREPHYEAIMKEIAARYPNVTYLSPTIIRARLAASGAVRSKGGVSPDHLHPSDEGQAVWLEILQPELDALAK